MTQIQNPINIPNISNQPIGVNKRNGTIIGENIKKTITIMIIETILII